MIPVRAFALWSVAALLTAGAVLAQKLEVSEQTLDNGLKIIIHEDHDIPNVALYLFYRIGSRNERPGTTGISHYFEHMMFNGTKKYGPKQFDIVMEKNGGANNAYTSNDITAYTDWFPREALELMFELEADRMVNLRFDPKIVESERGVVLNERKMAVDNSPGGALYEQMRAAAFTAHPYNWPVVGWASDIKAWTMDDLKHHYKMGYAPNNCTMVVTGDVSREEVPRLARKYFGPLPPQAPPPEVRTVEPEQQGERRVVVHKRAQLPRLLVAYHVPPTRDKDYYALKMLGSILAEGRSSRLYRRMVDGDQLVLAADYDYSRAIDPTLFYFSLRPRSGVAPAAAEKALYEELTRVVSAGVTGAELEKAKNIQLVDLYQGLQTIAGKANLLGRADVFLGDYRKLFTMGDDLAAVTREDVRRVARQYFTEDDRTVATLVPKEDNR